MASTLAPYAPKDLSISEWEDKFFQLLWKGWLAGSTPVVSNLGTNKGMPVSCSGQYIGDSIHAFYQNRHETAMLTKNGFGTSGYLGDIRSRGQGISTGGTASGVLPVIKGFVQDMRDVAQGTSRRGSFASYLPIDHGDFFEVIEHLQAEPDDLNIGWVISDEFIQRLDRGDFDAINRYQRSLKVKAITGKGYYFFIDKVNRLSPQSYKIHGLDVKASNLCTEIMLHSSDEETFTCVLSSMNLAKYDEWKDTSAVHDSIVFLDCVASNFLELADGVKGFEKSIAGTKRGRPLGLGTLGFHTYLQQNMIAFESFDAHMKNLEIFGRIKSEAEKATRYLAEALGEPEYCKGLGRRNTHLLAVAPNTSSALLCGGVSQGIEPVVANVYNQPTAAGEIYRVNPVFLELAKGRVGWTDEIVKGIIENNGSVQHLEWLTDHEKEVFKTAYEINQEVILRLASTRQQFIDQGQSVNLFFDADEDEAQISKIHQIGFKDPNIKALYYMRSKAGVMASTGSCLACEG